MTVTQYYFTQLSCFIFLLYNIFPLEPIPGNWNEPLELSFHSSGSQTGEGNGDNHTEQTRSSGDGEEDLRRSLQHQAQRSSALGSDAVPNGSNKGKQLGNGVFTRSLSAQPAMTLRKFNKSHSVLPPIPLKSGIVEPTLNDCAVWPLHKQVVHETEISV